MAIDNPAPVAPAEPSRGKRVKSDDEIALEETQRMKAYFDAQPKVSIKTREDEWVQVNGYTFIIKANERVEVPEDVARMLEDSGRI